ncbi:thioredoxin family protein [Paenibacillus sp. CMAA1364]
MRDLQELEVRDLLHRKDKPVVLFLYTPLCGTCTAAKRMLTVVEHLIPEDTITAINVNMMPLFAQEYKIRSVPAIMLMDAGHDGLPTIIYRMGSVEELLDAIRSVIE